MPAPSFRHPLCPCATKARCAACALCSAWYDSPFCSAWFRLRPVMQVWCQMSVASTERASCWCGTLPVWSAHAVGNPNDGCRSTEHVVAADRFARKIVRILTGFLVRLRRLNSTVGPQAIISRPRLSCLSSVAFCASPVTIDVTPSVYSVLNDEDSRLPIWTVRDAYHLL